MATTKRKGLPYLYVTWLAKFLAGDVQCEWSLWFQSRFNFAKVEDPSFDLAAWSKDHDDLVAVRAQQYTGSGYDVKVENQNYFQVKGQHAIIAGKMDLVARKQGYAIVADGKTGERRKSDWWQVLIYMAALPIIWKSGTMRISGEVFYKDQARVGVEPEELTAELRKKIFALAKYVGSMTQPPAYTPSPHECAFCKIGPNDCAKRMTMETAVAETEEF